MDNTINALNLRPFAKDIKDLSHLAMDMDICFNSIGNMSFIPLNEDEQLATFRIFGYFITSNQQRYLCEPTMQLENPDQHIFAILDRDYSLVKRLPVVKNEYYKPQEFQEHRTYLEDGRMNVWTVDGKPSIYFTTATFYTYQDSWEKFGLETQQLTISDDGIQAHHVWNSVESGIMGRHKNWMAVPDRPFTYISGTSSKGAQAVDISTTTITDIMDYAPSDMYRGNTPLVKLEDGYMTICHRLTEGEYGRKVYLNYFVKYDRNLRPYRISKPFKLTDENIEFITTMMVKGDDIIIGSTVMDETPEVLTFSRSTIDRAIW